LGPYLSSTTRPSLFHSLGSGKSSQVPPSPSSTNVMSYASLSNEQIAPFTGALALPSSRLPVPDLPPLPLQTAVSSGAPAMIRSSASAPATHPLLILLLYLPLSLASRSSSLVFLARPLPPCSPAHTIAQRLASLPHALVLPRPPFASSTRCPCPPSVPLASASPPRTPTAHG